MTICIIAEKPSVARDIARIVGCKQQARWLFTGRWLSRDLGDEASHYTRYARSLWLWSL